MTEEQKKAREEFKDKLGQINDITEALTQAGLMSEEEFKELQRKSQGIEKNVAKIEKQEQRLDRIEKKEGCFVATAVYESYDHPSVIVLRRFRDEYLMKRNWGIAFVDFYYTYGPGWAKKVQRHRFLKGLFYVPIQLFVRLLSK